MDPSFSSYLISTGKAALEQTHVEGDEFMPTLVVEDGDGRFNIMALVGGHPYNMVLAAIPMLRDMHPRCIGMTADSYYSLVGHEDDDVLARRERYNGSLAAMFEAGEPGVSESLMITIVRAHEAQSINLPYTRTATGIVWGEDVVPRDALSSGRMVDALRMAWL